MIFDGLDTIFYFNRKEIYILTKAAIIHAYNISVFAIVKTCSLFVLFSVTTASGVDLSSHKIFLTLAVVAYIRHENALNFSFQLMKLSDITVALKRIQVSKLKYRQVFYNSL